MTRLWKRFVIVALPTLVLALAACSPQEPEVPDATASSLGWGTAKEPPLDGFVGNDACAPCHKVNFASHTHSRHMQTLREGTKTALGELAPPAGKAPEVGTIVWEQDQLVLEAPNKDTGEPVPIPVDLVLGSGKTGMTYLAIHDRGSVEIRQSFFPHEPTKKWIVTPGQETFDKSVIGQSHAMPDVLRCVGCHSVATPSSGPIPERRFFGVGCESCHGPGSEHVSLMEKKDKSQGLKIRVLRGMGGTELNALCGKCHRTPEKVETMDARSKQATNRFQPYGLSLSACFKKSGDKLSCATCHNPHQDASRDERGYEKVCLSCHSPSVTPSQRACPVNPKEKCVTCHMPTKPVFPGTSFPIKMADHFIRVYKDGKPAR